MILLNTGTMSSDQIRTLSCVSWDNDYRKKVNGRSKQPVKVLTSTSPIPQSTDSAYIVSENGLRSQIAGFAGRCVGLSTLLAEG